MKHENYCGYAANDILRYINGWKMNNYPVQRKYYMMILQLLKEGQKFLLPPGGRVIGNSVPPEDFNIPFPVTIAEYAMPEFEGHDKTLDNGGIASNHRISLAVESEYWNEMMGKFELVSEPVPSGRIVIVPIYDEATSGTWNVGWAALSVSKQLHARKATAAERNTLESLNTYKGAHAVDGITYMYIGEVNNEIYLTHIMQGLNLTSNLARDTSDEFWAMIELSQALSCSNVTTVKAPAAAQSSTKKEKPKFYSEYKMLSVEITKHTAAAVEASGFSGLRSSPRTHLRRGHIRHLPDKNIWINSMVVNPGHSTVDKIYKVKP